LPIESLETLNEVQLSEWIFSEKPKAQDVHEFQGTVEQLGVALGIWEVADSDSSLTKKKGPYEKQGELAFE
jgi:hypothetical protein